MRVLRGRTFASGAAGRAERAVLINRVAADSMWPTQDPIGRCIRFKRADAPCYMVIGVTQAAILTGVKDASEPQLYVPIENMPFDHLRFRDVVLRVEPERLTLALEQVRLLLEREIPGAKFTTHTMAEMMEPEYRPWRLGATLFTLFGALAALVAAIGVYSAVSYAVSQRAHEFGVRMALGATGGSIVGQVVRDALRPVAIGVVAGLVIALASGRIIASLLYDLSPDNALAMTLAGSTLLAIAVVASIAPAWRAKRSDPVTVLRSD
jgi:ABC-type antimicrobial peptide transport system permease subunit